MAEQRCWFTRIAFIFPLILWQVNSFAPLLRPYRFPLVQSHQYDQRSFVAKTLEQESEAQGLNIQAYRLAPLQQYMSEPEGQSQQPLLARAYSRVLRWGVGSVFAPLGFGQIEGLRVEVKAPSNWAIVRGHIEELRIRCDRIRSSPIVQISRGFDLQGNELRFGIAPAVCLLAPPSFFLYLASSRIRRLLQIPIFFGFLSLVTGVQPGELVRKWLPNTSVDTTARKKDVKHTVLTYRLALSGDDLSAKNTVVRVTLRRAMETLLRSSVVGVALSTAAAAAAASADASKTQEQQIAEMLTALEENESATTIKLKKVAIEKGGKLLFDAAATFPQPGASVENENQLYSTLDFVVRAKVAPLEEKRFRDTSQTSLPPAKQQLLLQGNRNEGNEGGNNSRVQSGQPSRPDRCGVMISDAEVKASFTKETDSGKIVPLEVFGRPIPDLWFPLGSGTVAYPFGRGHRVTSVVTQLGSDDAGGEDRIDLCGEFYIGTEAPPVKNEWKMPFTKSSSQSNGNSPPPPPPPRRLGPSTLLPTLPPPP